MVPQFLPATYFGRGKSRGGDGQGRAGHGGKKKGNVMRVDVVAKAEDC